MKSLQLVLAIVLTSAVFSALEHARAEPEPAIDRALVERLVRAEEDQARAIKHLTEVIERKR